MVLEKTWTVCLKRFRFLGLMSLVEEADAALVLDKECVIRVMFGGIIVFWI